MPLPAIERFVLGCGNFGGIGSAPELFGQGNDEPAAFALMDAAWALGIRWFDTADDAEALVARPRELGDNASPSGQSAMVQALATYAALTGSGAHRTAAEETLAVLATLAERAPRFAGHALAGFVAKPYSQDELADAVRRALAPAYVI